MDSKRQGEIALVLVKALAKREGAEKLMENLQRLQKISDETGIPVAELKEFCEIIVHELVEEYFTEKVK